MKKYLLLFFLISISFGTYAQLSGINTKTLNSNTYLHLDEKTGAAKIYKGVLTSRYSTADRDSKFSGIGVAENGLLIYNTTENCYNYWKHNGTTGVWVSLCGCLPGTAPLNFYANCGTAVSTYTKVVAAVAVPAGSKITVPIVVANAGTINAYSYTTNGVTFSNSAIAVDQSTTSYTIDIAGTPATSTNIFVPIKDNNGNTICNVIIYGYAVYTCTSADAPNATGVNSKYIATTKLTSGVNYIDMVLNVTTPGYISIDTEDKNGMYFTFNNGNAPITTTNPALAIKLLPDNSTSVITDFLTVAGGSTPNTSEETSIGSNGSNDQAATYTPKNILKPLPVSNQNLTCPVTIDVKPFGVGDVASKIPGATAVILDNTNTGSGTKYWVNNNSKQYAADAGSNYVSVMPTDKRVILDMDNVANYSGLYNMLWYIYVKNVSGTPITNYSFNVRSTCDAGNYTYTGAGAANIPVPNNGRIGSLDAYANSSGVATANSSTAGAHGAGKSSIINYRENGDFGITLQIGTKWYKYRAMFNSYQVGSNNYETKPTLVLFGIYNAQPAVYVPTQTNMGGGGDGNPAAQRDPTTYWP